MLIKDRSRVRHRTWMLGVRPQSLGFASVELLMSSECAYRFRCRSYRRATRSPLPSISLAFANYHDR
jgi:hypothetical protein